VIANELDDLVEASSAAPIAAPADRELAGTAL